MSLYTPEELENYADVLHWALALSRAVPLKNADPVLIHYDVAAAPLAEAVYARLLAAHLHPLPLARPTSAMERDLFHHGSFGQLMYQQPGLSELFGAVAGVITILAPDALGHLGGIDPRTLADAAEAARPARDPLENRKRRGEVGWTVCLYPTPALAQAAGVDLAEYARLLLRACGLTLADPVRQWQRKRQELGEVARWLNGMKATAYHLESEGSDLMVETGRMRRWVGVNGHNVPGCELYFSPDWRGVHGVFTADMPSVRQGHVVRGVRLEFSGGTLVRATAEGGSAFLNRQLTAVRNAGRLGEFSLTDRRHSLVTRFMAHTLLDENHGGESGNCHVALGASYPETFSGPVYELTPELSEELGFNASPIHWDLIATEPRRVTARVAGGKKVCVYEDGEFRY